MINDVWFPEGKWAEDVAYTVEVFCRCRKAVYIDHPYYCYRLLRPGCLTLTPNIENLLEVTENAMGCLRRYGYHRLAPLLFYSSCIELSDRAVNKRTDRKIKRKIMDFLGENRGVAVGLLKGNDIGKKQKIILGMILISPKLKQVVFRIYSVFRKLWAVHFPA